MDAQHVRERLLAQTSPVNTEAARFTWRFTTEADHPLNQYPSEFEGGTVGQALTWNLLTQEFTSLGVTAAFAIAARTEGKFVA